MSGDEEQQSLERLRAVRRGHRGVVTKITKEADTLLTGDEPSRERINKLNVIYEQLENKLQTLQCIDREILAVCKLEEIDREIDESEVVNAKILDCKRRLRAATKPLPTSAVTSETSPISVTTNPLMSASQTRLPKLTISKFKGDATQWIPFWDSFKAAIDDNKGITKVDKFNYLSSLLEGVAARTIQGLKLTESNYDAAIELLQKRFGNTQQIVSAHMEELLKLPVCSSDRVSSLRYVHDKILVHIRGLKSLGVDSKQYGSLLIPVVMSKLPGEVRLRIARENHGELWDIDNLMATIAKELEAREASESTKVTQPKTPSFTKPPSVGGVASTASSLVANTQSIRCAYCNGSHYSASCNSVKDVKERKEILIRAGRCFNCLKPNHRAKDCDRRGCRFCQRKHHQSLHEVRPINEQTISESLGDTVVSNPTHSNISTVKSKQVILLQTARAVATNKDGTISQDVRILFDTGSQRSYVTDSLKGKLQLAPFDREKLNLNTFGESRFKTQSCDVVQVLLHKPGSNETVTIKALTFPNICSPLPGKIDLDRFPSLHELDLSDYVGPSSHNTIDILVGTDYYWSLVTGEFVRVKEGLVAVESKLGWLLSGPTEACVLTEGVHTNLVLNDPGATICTSSESDHLQQTLKLFWEVESSGVCAQQESVNPNCDFLQGLKFDEHRYHVDLPWNRDKQELADHYQLCDNRLKSLQRRLINKPDVLQQYHSVIQEQLKRGIIELVPEDTQQTAATIHYMPHHPVIRQNHSTTKVRVVYDGSAKIPESNLSLNDCLQKGPNLIPKLFNVLLRFRCHLVTLTADIEKAFLMIGINKCDQDCLRFLWFKNPHDTNSKLIHLKFTRLVFGLKPSPAILGAVIEKHVHNYQHQYPEVVNVMQNSLYVDDLVTGAETEDEAFELYLTSKRLMSEGGFNLRKWKTNCPTLMNQIKSFEGSKEEQKPNPNDSAPLVTEPDEGSKLLGVYWDHQRDQFLICFTELCHFALSLPLNKRSVLRVSAGIFDPLGFLSPFVVRLKILFQRLCADYVRWDDPLQGETLTEWKSILDEIANSETITIPRYYLLQQRPTKVQLHGFSDASQSAYAAVIYVRSIYPNGNIETRLAASKTKIAPMKAQTIPRLELLGALLLAQLFTTVSACISFASESLLWVDSMTVLYWIRNDKPWKQYILHRVETIRRLTQRERWRHCPGELNPADLPSRGSRLWELKNCSTWWKGPSFLQLSEPEWPPQNLCEMSGDVKNELVKHPPPITLALLSQTWTSACTIDDIISCDKYSNVHHLLKVTGYVLRFIKRLNRGSIECNQSNSKELIPSEIHAAELMWIRAIQMKSFSPEFHSLTVNKSSTSLLVKQFGLFIDDKEGVLRCKGRINNSSVCLSTKNPMLLPSKHHFVKLLIRRAHHKSMHGGVRDTLMLLREQYWILKGRQSVRKIIRCCVVCRKFEGAAYHRSQVPDLPDVRVSEDPPFTHTGLDFAGLLMFKLNRSNRDSPTEKAYVCLFTCASTRGVHLELTRSLTVEDFLLAFRRFTSRRGVPAVLISDNAKTFKASSREITKIARSAELSHYLTDNRIKWTFIVERAPWWGGFWERLIQSVKKSLRKVIGRGIFDFEQLRTIIVEVESVINARPLTYLHDDTEGISYTLSPSHFMHGRRICNVSNTNHFEVTSTFQSLTKRWKLKQRLLGQFVKQWRRDYLLNLRECHNLNCKKISRSPILIGDVVILRDDLTKRVFWKLATIEELLRGKDGIARAAVVKVVNENGSFTLLRRSIQHLIPLEVNS